MFIQPFFFFPPQTQPELLFSPWQWDTQCMRNGRGQMNKTKYREVQVYGWKVKCVCTCVCMHGYECRCEFEYMVALDLLSYGKVYLTGPKGKDFVLFRTRGTWRVFLLYLGIKNVGKSTWKMLMTLLNSEFYLKRTASISAYSLDSLSERPEVENRLGWKINKDLSISHSSIPSWDTRSHLQDLLF